MASKSVITFLRAVVMANEDIEEIEEIIGMGQIEELIQQAEDEFDALDTLWGGFFQNGAKVVANWN